MKKSPQEIHQDGVYLSELSPKDKTWDKHRANSDLVRYSYSHLGYDRYPERINDCSRLLEFVLKENSEVSQDESLFRLFAAKFCRVRFCPVCQWRRTLMWRARFFKAVPDIRANYLGYHFIFLTLTVRNCGLDELRKTVDWMNKSWNKFYRRKVFPAIGWVKAVEVTPGKNGKFNEFHPHFHCILIVPKNYFRNSTYLNKDKWIDLWQKSLKVDYRPSIKVNKVGLKPNRRKKLVEKLGRDLTEDEVVFYGLMECLKYSVKEGDLVANLNWLDAVTKQLHGTRAIALGGIFKEYLSEDEPEDLIHTELEDNIDTSEIQAKFMFGWNQQVKRYQSM